MNTSTRAGTSPAKPDTFAERLNRLFASIYPPGRGPYRNIEVTRALSRRGHAMSGPYLSQLRTGQRTHPSRQTIDLLAEFFGVGSDYLSGVDSGYTRWLDNELRWLQIARNPAVRELTTALLTLPPGVRNELLAAPPHPYRSAAANRVPRT